MKWHYTLLSGTKLWLSFGVIVVFLGVVMVTAYLGMSGIQEGYTAALALAAYERNNNDQRAATLTMFSTSDQTDREAARRIIVDCSTRNDALFPLLRTLLKNDSRGLGRIEELDATRMAHKRTRDETVIPLILAGKLDEAKALSLGVQQERYMTMRNLASRLSEQAKERADTVARRAVTTLLFELLFAFLISLVVFRSLSLLSKLF